MQQADAECLREFQQNPVHSLDPTDAMSTAVARSTSASARQIQLARDDSSLTSSIGQLANVHDYPVGYSDQSYEASRLSSLAKLHMRLHYIPLTNDPPARRLSPRLASPRLASPAETRGVCHVDWVSGKRAGDGMGERTYGFSLSSNFYPDHQRDLPEAHLD